MSTSDTSASPIAEPAPSAPEPSTSKPGRIGLESSSSPNLLRHEELPGGESLKTPSGIVLPRVPLTRSKTLPRSPTVSPNALVHPAFVELEEDKLTRFRQWMVAIAVVVFDVDYGPKIDILTPAVELSQTERSNIAFSAFPDSHPHPGTQIHTFRIRSERKISSSEEDGTICPSDGFLYGYSAFIQQLDKSSKRGYSQRSLVILSPHPFPALFSAAVAAATPLFVKHGIETLETACHNVCNWPGPTAGATLELGFLGSILHVELPQHIDQQQLTETSSFGEAFDPECHILASYPPTDLTAVDVFAPILSNLWSVWECLVLSEPIFVHGVSPTIVSTAVWWLRDWLRPLPLAGDFRPYFTIHDVDHRRLASKNAPQASVILGTTNPFIYEECKHWPHIMGLGEGSAGLRRRQGPSSSPGTKGAPGPSIGFKTTHRRYLSKDHGLLRQLENALRPGTSRSERLRVSNLLRQHFTSRATGLLVPLNRYLTCLIPAPRSSPMIPAEGSGSALPRPSARRSGSRPRVGPPSSRTGSPASLRMAPFSSEDMLASLARFGSPLPFKSGGRRREFYERWLRSNAFGAWLMREEEIVKRVLTERERDEKESRPYLEVTVR